MSPKFLLNTEVVPNVKAFHEKCRQNKKLK